MIIDKSAFFKNIPEYRKPDIIDKEYLSSKPSMPKPIIILDDDPTGIQTTHDIDLYTVWDSPTMDEIFSENKTAFIQTNTRAYPEDKVKKLISGIMDNLINAALKYKRDFEIISRSDSTLRGHFPFETDLIHQQIGKKMGKAFDGEILIPFFPEGGRFTANNLHYVFDGEGYTPAAETEFARDPDFGYRNSDLTKYIEEKTGGKYPAGEVKIISLEMIRKQDIRGISEILLQTKDFKKIIVNSLDYNDLKIFTTALQPVITQGKKFLYRSAASFVKVFIYNESIPLLNGPKITGKTSIPGRILLIAGSYTGKTSAQLDTLIRTGDVSPVEIRAGSLIGQDDIRAAEIQRVGKICDELLSRNGNPVLFTSRKLITGQNHLETGARISSALVDIVQMLNQSPHIIIIKGGITSSDITSRALKIRKARVMGQILPGVPVISAGSDCKWPGIPCIIFPGNVGNTESLLDIYLNLGAVN